MRHLVIRTGSRLRRRLGIILAGAVLIVAVVFALRPKSLFGRPDLQLVALDANGLFSDEVVLPRAWADTTFKGAYGATARVPLIFGVRNVGSVQAGARALRLSVPSRYRLETGEGRELPHRSEAGNPLVRYTINGPFPPVEPGRLPSVLPSVDTVWLEPVVPQLYCVSVGDSVPEFVAAGEPDARLLSRIRIFYSFDDTGSPGRQAGLLTVQLDPSLVERPPAVPPPAFPTRLQEPAWPLPAMGVLHRAGTNTASCGPPDAPMELRSTVWQTDVGGRLIVLDIGGKPRKYLFDLNRDSTVELEMWDATGRGRFDAMREARYPIPPFLLPPPIPPFNMAVFAGLPPDSLARLYGFREAGVYRPVTEPPNSAMDLDRFRDAGIYTPRGPQPAGGVGVVVGGAGTTRAASAPNAAAPTAPAPSTARPQGAPAGPKLLARPPDSAGAAAPRPDTGG